MKRLFSILLAVCLLAGLASAGAVPATAVNGDDFKIITQPQAVTVPYGSSFTLSVEVNVPAGVEVVSCVWRPYSGMHGADAGSVLHVSPGDPMYPEAYRPYLAAYVSYYCVITAVEVDAGGNPVGSPWEIYSESAAVTVLAQRDMNLFEAVSKAVTDFFATAFLWSYLGVMWFFGILLTPYYWIRDLFR